MAADRGGATGTRATIIKWPLGGLSNLFIFISVPKDTAGQHDEVMH